MRRKITISMLLVMGVLLVVASVWLFNGQILRSNPPVFVKTVVQLFMPPKDLYYPLVVDPIDTNEGVVTKTISYHHEYSGKHRIGVVFGGIDALSFSEGISFNLGINIDCYVDKELRYSRVVKSANPLFGRQMNGYILDTYEVPRELPLDEVIDCVVTVSGTKELLKQHGITRIYIEITKMSDV